MDLISGTHWPQDRHQSDVFVLQLSYTGIANPSIRPGLLYLDLGDDHVVGGVGSAADQWMEAVDGNFAGSPQPPVNLSWEYFRAANPGDLTNLLGNTGWVDDGNGNGVAWAVLDYDNAQFAVPEPASLSLLALGGLALLRRRK
jgi:hypothetical protein